MSLRHAAGTLLLAVLATASIAPAGAVEGSDAIHVAETIPADRETAATRKLRALLEEIVAGGGYASLPKLDETLARMRALGPEVAGTRAAPIYERTLKDLEGERSRLAAQLVPGTAAAGAVQGAYIDYDWLGQQAFSALTNPLQRETFRASLARGIDFNIGVSAIEPAAAGWLVQMSGRLGSPGTPGQGFFCRVNGADSASLAVLRGITPPYGIVHMTAARADEFILADRPLRIRIVFSDCRITPPDNAPRGNTMTGASGGTAITAQAVAGGSSGAGPIAPSPAGLRCQITPRRREHERVMAHRLRQAWALPEALRDDPSLSLTFAVTLNLDAELTGPVELLRSTSQRATPQQLHAAVEAGRQAIVTSAPFPELGQFAGGTMQVDMTLCD